MVSVPFIPYFSPFVISPNLLDAERSHTYCVLGSLIRYLYYIMLPLLGFRMALMYSLVAVSDKGYTLLWLGVYIVLTSLLIMIACNASTLNHVGYLCVLGWSFQLYVLIWGLISSRTSSTLISSTALRVPTLGGGFLTLGRLVVMGLSDVGSDLVFVVASKSIVDISLSAVKVFSLKGEKGCVGFGCFHASEILMPPLLLCWLMIILSFCIVWGKIHCVTHTRCQFFCSVYFPVPVVM